MSRRPSRAKMCSWLSGEIRNIRLSPQNPADIATITTLRRQAETRLIALSDIAAELGWHVDADLDRAYALIKEYEKGAKNG